MKMLRVFGLMLALLLGALVSGSVVQPAEAAATGSATVGFNAANRVLDGNFGCVASTGYTYWKQIRKWKVNGTVQETATQWMTDYASYYTGPVTWTWWNDFDAGDYVQAEVACYYSYNGIPEYTLFATYTSSALFYTGDVTAIIENTGTALVLKCLYHTGPESVTGDVWIVGGELKKNNISYYPPVTVGVLEYDSNTSDAAISDSIEISSLNWTEGDTLSLVCFITYDTPSISPVLKVTSSPDYFP